MEEEGCMEYMRGLLRDNDLFRAYVTVRAGERADGQGCGTPRPPPLQVRGRRSGRGLS